MITVGDIFDVIDEIAPFSLASDFDNVGLLVGEKSSKVKKVLLCLDITSEIATEAAQNGFDVVISHHPVIFNSLYTLSNNNPAVILSKNNISAICAHTNLDAAHGGINDIIAKKLNVKVTSETIETTNQFPYYQLAVFVPTENAKQVYDAMCSAGAGELGNYKNCAFSVEGTGNFLPLEGSDAYIGEVGEATSVKETRLEMIVPHHKRRQVIQAMLDAHPYEKVAYNLSENQAIIEKFGFGKVGELPTEYSAKEFAEFLKKTFGNTVVRYNDTKKPIKTVGFCSGGGGGIVKDAIKLGLDAYVCGDVKHDQFIDAQNAGLAVFDAGHFHTENIVLEYLQEVLTGKFPEISVLVATANRDILSYE